MKVKDLLEEINRCRRKYPDFLEWDVYTEQLSPYDRRSKKSKNPEVFGSGWEIVKDSDGWEYFKCVGFWTKMPKEKIFTINVNY